MRYIDSFKGWNPINLFKDIGDFSIKFQPSPNEKEEVLLFNNTSRKEVIRKLLKQYPQIKIISISKS